jgi:hypothetical protein
MARTDGIQLLYYSIYTIDSIGLDIKILQIHKNEYLLIN